MFRTLWNWIKYTLFGIDYTNRIVILYNGKEVNKMILKDCQQGNLAVMARTKKGHPGQIEGTPVWSVANGSIATIATITPASDGLSAVVSAGVDLGDVVITVAAQVMSSGVLKTLTKDITITIVAGDPVELFIIEGAITEVP
jgi:hypothetical protein